MSETDNATAGSLAFVGVMLVMIGWIIGILWCQFSVFRQCETSGKFERRNTRIICRVEYKQFPKESPRP